MKLKPWIICTCLSGAIALATFGSSKKLFPEQQVVLLYRQDVGRLEEEVATLVRLVEENRPAKQVQQQFKAARAAYKKTEWMAEYFNTYTAKGINGPALPEVEQDEKDIIIHPEGFQVVEEILFPSYDKAAKQTALEQIRRLQSNVGRLKTTAAILQTTGEHIFDALRLEVFRLISLGISGFDSPIAHNSLPEASATLQAIQQAYSVYAGAVRTEDALLEQKLQATFREAQAYLQQHPDFDTFDRMHFITRCLNPLSEQLLLAQKLLHVPIFKEPRVIRPGAKTLFAENVFTPDYYLTNIGAVTTEEKVALGKQLFYDNALSGNGQRNCASCHRPEKAFTDGLATSLGLNGKPVRRNAPTLINAALQPSLFWDTRVFFLEDQIKAVIHNKDEMDGSLEKAVLHLNKNEVYRQQFKKAYRDTASEYTVCNAIASYIRTLIGLNSRFDQYMRGDFSAMNRKEIDGFNLFMGKAKCGTCHFAPLFNGSVPPQCDKIDAEIIGVPATTDTVHPRLDPDEGKFGVHGIALHRHAFKTATVRNSAVTAPYMHNGVYNTLEEVVEFYNRGGGAGMGIKVDNQTLPDDRLHLTPGEKESLVSFLKTLTDTTSYSR